MIQTLQNTSGKGGTIKKADKRRLRDITGIVIKTIPPYVGIGKNTVGQPQQGLFLECLSRRKTITYGS